MSDFRPQALTKIQNVLKESYINALKSEFIINNTHPEDLPVNIDDDKGVLEFWDNHEGKFYEVKFEDNLDGILWNATQELISEINSSVIHLNQSQKTRYWNLISSTFENIERQNQSLFKQFPVCSNPKNHILRHLEKNFDYSPVSKFYDNSYFTYKESKYEINDFRRVYKFLAKEYFIDDEITYDEFFSVFNDKETTCKITFNCETPVIISILEGIKLFFNDFTPKRIAESARFFTKPGKFKQSTPITVSIYNTNIKRGKKPGIISKKKMIQEFFSDNFPD